MKKNAFTLAEVLITLGIIGVVAALTMPALIANYQQKALKTQYAKAYSNLFNAIKLAQANLDYPIGCSYWDANPTGCSAKCVGYNEYDECNSWTCQDGSALPSEYNGPRGDCQAFEQELFHNVLKPIKFCKDHALANGCITTDFKGIDEVKKEQTPTGNFNPNGGWAKTNIQNNYSAYVLADGTIIMKYGVEGTGSYPIYTIDINGRKKPNKWGYDIFTFEVFGDSTSGIKYISPITYATETGGVSGAQMQQQLNQ